MFNMLKVIDLGPAASDDDAQRLRDRLSNAGSALPGIRSHVVGRTLPRAINGGQVMWRAVFATESDYWICAGSPQWHTTIDPLISPNKGVSIDTAIYKTGMSDCSAGRQQDGIWRCLVLSVDSSTSTNTVRQFEKDLLLMPTFVGAIRNWSLSPIILASGHRRWTHIWEQEFDDVAGLEGEYMLHPVHWGLVDGWFDPECPQRIVDPWLIHASINITDVVIR
jgi:hypothetical protein